VSWVAHHAETITESPSRRAGLKDPPCPPSRRRERARVFAPDRRGPRSRNGRTGGNRTAPSGSGCGALPRFHRGDRFYRDPFIVLCRRGRVARSVSPNERISPTLAPGRLGWSRRTPPIAGSHEHRVPFYPSLRWRVPSTRRYARSTGRSGCEHRRRRRAAERGRGGRIGRPRTGPTAPAIISGLD
jgi:hypothetical protein